MEKTIHICTAADSNYKLPLKCLHNSIYKNSTSHPCIVHVLYTGLSAHYRNKLHRKYQGTNLSIDFVDMSNFKIDTTGINMQYWTNAIFYRIMIPEIFKNLNRILYIDGDTLVMGDLFEFFNTKFDSNTNMAMVVDRFSWGHQKERLSLSNYFNSGVILFDIKKSKQDNFINKCIDWLRNNPDKAIYPDQDAINCVCNGKILRIDNIHNKMVCDDDNITNIDNAKIVHFLSEIKPWHSKSHSKFNRIYLQYAPQISDKIYIRIKQILDSIKNFCFHRKYVMPLKKSRILKQYKYYICNICVYTKTLDKTTPDLITILKKAKESKNVH